MTLSAPLTRGIDRDSPLCEASPGYIGQLRGSPVIPPADLAAGDAGVGGAGNGAGLAAPEQPAPAAASRTTNAPARTQPKTVPMTSNRWRLPSHVMPDIHPCRRRWFRLSPAFNRAITL